MDILDISKIIITIISAVIVFVSWKRAYDLKREKEIQRKEKEDFTRIAVSALRKNYMAFYMVSNVLEADSDLRKLPGVAKAIGLADSGCADIKEFMRMLGLELSFERPQQMIGGRRPWSMQ